MESKIKEERKYVSYDRKFLATGLDVLNMILLTEIENLSKLPNGCYATDEQLGQVILVGRQNTNERVKLLERLGYVKCQTTYINKKRRRSILFTYIEGMSSRGDSGRRSHISKVKSSQDDTPCTPQDDNNKIAKEVNTGIPESDHRNAVKEDSDQTKLVLENIGPKKENLVEVTPTKILPDQIVPDSSLRSGVVGDNEEDQEEELMDDGTFKELRKILNEDLKPICPNWEKSLRNKPFEIFLNETVLFHKRRPEYIELFQRLRTKFQPEEYTF